MTTRYKLLLAAFVGLYLTASLAPMLSIIGLNYLIAPDHNWSVGLSRSEEITFMLAHIAWAAVCLVYSGRATVMRYGKAVTA
tara:strand:- start:398 stop:643 length:246 start_codon:yes stop_codon:yes gene_type:complete